MTDNHKYKKSHCVNCFFPYNIVAMSVLSYLVKILKRLTLSISSITLTEHFRVVSGVFKLHNKAFISRKLLARVDVKKTECVET